MWLQQSYQTCICIVNEMSAGVYITIASHKLLLQYKQIVAMLQLVWLCQRSIYVSCVITMKIVCIVFNSWYTG